MVSVEFGVKMLLGIVVIVAGVMVVFVWLLPWLQKSVFANAWWSNIFPSENIENPDLENAIKCAYYRCAKGCNSNEVQSFTAVWPDPQTHNDASCADFCKSGKSTICNSDAQNNTVNVDIGEKSYLSEELLKKLVGSTCITTNPLGGLPADAVIITSYSTIDQDSIKDTQTTCSLQEPRPLVSYTSLNLLPGKYGIFMYNDGGRTKIYISPYQSPSSSSSTSSYGTCSEQGGTCTIGLSCPTGTKNLGRLDCAMPQPKGGFGQICCK
jgi:hypothetical protein